MSAIHETVVTELVVLYKKADNLEEIIRQLVMPCEFDEYFEVNNELQEVRRAINKLLR